MNDEEQKRIEEAIEITIRKIMGEIEEEEREMKKINVNMVRAKVRLELYRLLERIGVNIDETVEETIKCKGCGRELGYCSVRTDFKLHCPFCGREQLLTKEQYKYYMFKRMEYTEEENDELLEIIEEMYEMIVKLYEIDHNISISLNIFSNDIIAKFSEEGTNKWYPNFEELVYECVPEEIRKWMEIRVNEQSLNEKRAIVYINFYDKLMDEEEEEGEC